MFGEKPATFRVKLSRNKDKINIAYRGKENCKICQRISANQQEKVEEVTEVSTPKRKIQMMRRTLSKVIATTPSTYTKS